MSNQYQKKSKFVSSKVPDLVSQLLADYEPLLTIDEVAKITRWSRRTVVQKISDKILLSTKLDLSCGSAGRKLGRRVVFKSSLEKLIRDGMDA